MIIVLHHIILYRYSSAVIVLNPCISLQCSYSVASNSVYLVPAGHQHLDLLLPCAARTF